MATPNTYAVVTPTYQPAMRIVTAITNAFPAAVTTSFAHNYLDGLIVRLYVPQGFGMIQANELFGPITVTGASSFTISIDTTTFDAFVNNTTAPWYIRTYAQCVPTGEINSQLNQATHNVKTGI